MINPRKILLIQTASIGDVILFTPVLEQLHASYPEAAIHLLIKAGHEQLFDGHPFLSKLWVWDKKQSKYSGLFKLVAALRKEGFDWVVNAQRFAATGLITVLSGASVRIGFNKNPFSLLFTNRIPHQIHNQGSNMHEVERNLSLIASFTDSNILRPRLYPSAAAQTKTQALKSKPYICIAPASLWFTKQYPEEKWIELVQKIPEKFKIYLLGSPADQVLCTQICKKSGNSQCENLAGKLSLLESTSLMQDAHMNFVNDSAPMHLCSAVNAKTTAIYCSTIPEFGFGPLAEGAKVVQTAEKLNCRPCGLHGHQKCPEGHFKCGHSIEVNQLLQCL